MAFSLKKSFRRMRVRLSEHGREICAMHDQLEGQLAIEESGLLGRLGRGRRKMVEVGSYRGKSTALLAFGGGPGCEVVAIDPHLVFDGRNVAGYNDDDRVALENAVRRQGLADRVTHWPVTSRQGFAKWQAERPGEMVDLVFIDGDHNYEEVLFDLRSWAGILSPGGILAAHDYGHWEGVNKAWDEFVVRNPAGWAPGPRARSIISAIKR